MKMQRKMFVVLVVITVLTFFVATAAIPAQAVRPDEATGIPADFWWTLLMKVLIVAVPPLAAALTAWLIQQAREVGKHISANTMTYITWATQLAVNAAEQAGAAGLIQEKKSYAIDLATRWLTSQGIKIDLALLGDAIEAAVRTEINKTAPVLPAETK